ncbi:MAG TPA: hypothetical protein VNR87_03585 [Flavisolibacter sp.]|nr:hypothetical protein [Flavisolibacter sp.]
MTARTKILVVDSDLDSLSRVYLALVHRKYKVEATDKFEETAERVKRLKPAVVILGKNEFFSLDKELKVPVILLLEKDELTTIATHDELKIMEKHAPIDMLIRSIEELVI